MQFKKKKNRVAYKVLSGSKNPGAVNAFCLLGYVQRPPFHIVLQEQSQRL